jgi:hypothetical protein
MTQFETKVYIGGFSSIPPDCADAEVAKPTPATSANELAITLHILSNMVQVLDIDNCIGKLC